MELATDHRESGLRELKSIWSSQLTMEESRLRECESVQSLQLTVESWVWENMSLVKAFLIDHCSKYLMREGCLLIELSKYLCMECLKQDFVVHVLESISGRASDLFDTVGLSLVGWEFILISLPLEDVTIKDQLPHMESSGLDPTMEIPSCWSCWPTNVPHSTIRVLL